MCIYVDRYKYRGGVKGGCRGGGRQAASAPIQSVIHAAPCKGYIHRESRIPSAARRMLQRVGGWVQEATPTKKGMPGKAPGLPWPACPARQRATPALRSACAPLAQSMPPKQTRRRAQAQEHLADQSTEHFIRSWAIQGWMENRQTLNKSTNPRTG